MKKFFSLLLAIIMVMPFMISCGNKGNNNSEGTHQHTYREVVHKPTCTEDGYTEYICDCGHSYKGDIVEALGHDYERKDYSLFLGSSIFYGHLKGYSFVDMMSEDYITLNKDDKTDYYKRNKDLEDSGNFGDSSVYRCDDKVVIIDKDMTTARIGNNNVTLSLENGKYKAYKGNDFLGEITVNKGDEQVYKLAANGASMAFFTPEELKHQNGEYERRSYWYRLTEFAKDIERVDNFYLQLSTNDASWKTKGDVEFGEILPDDKRELSDFDYTTSFGAMEYMIAWARERWNCRVTVVVCPYISMSGDFGRFYSELVDQVPALQKKWNISVLDLYHDEEIYKNVTSTDSEWLNKYMYPDRVHLTDIGYEAWILPKVRAFIDKEGWQTDENGNEYRICGRCGHIETR